MKKIAIKAVRLIPQIVLNAVIIFLLVIMVYPLLMALWNALKLNYLFESTKWYPTFPLVVSNLTDSFLQLWEYILNTLIVALFGGGGLMFITSISAYTFSKMRFPGRKLLYSMTIALMMMPGVLTIIPQVAIYNKLGLVGTDNLFALILPLWTNGTIFGIFLLTAFFSGIPNDMFEAARIDGAGEFKCYYAIALPMCLPILFTLAIMTLVNIWNDYLWPMTVMREKFTIASALVKVYNTADASNQTMKFAGYLVSSIPLIALFIVANKYYIQGLIGSSIKL